MTYSTMLVFSNFWLINSADGLMRLDERLFTDALEVSKYSQLAARTLQKAKIEAESVSQLHRAFVANISHELRTPLNSIIAFNSLLMEDETLTEAQREFVSSAIVSAEALLGIIGAYWAFHQIPPPCLPIHD
jgi:signal transduction histidine kinase